MAFITKANAKSIIFKIDVNSLDIEGDLYKTPINFFNKYEEKSLLAIKELFLDSENFLNEYYKPIITVDTLNFVFEGKPPAYHKSVNCNRLISDYENFQIPELIKNKGKDTVEKFRKWFKENKHLLSKPDIFIALLQMKWGVFTNVKNISEGNTGPTEFENLTPKEIERRIDTIIKKAANLYYEETEILKNFRKHAYLGDKSDVIKNNNTGFSQDKVKEVLSYFENNIKKPIKNLLIQYFRVTINPELNFNDKLLEQLGFKRCSLCYKKINLEFNPKTTKKINTNNSTQKSNNIQQVPNLKTFSKSTIESSYDNALPLYEVIDGSEFTTEVTLNESSKGGVYLSLINPITKRSEIVGMGAYFDILCSDICPMEIGKPYLAEIVFRQPVPGLTLEMAKAAYPNNPRAIDNFARVLSKASFKRLDVQYIAI